MFDWVQKQEWSAELWVSAWVAIVVLVTVVLWEYDKHQHPRR